MVLFFELKYLRLSEWCVNFVYKYNLNKRKSLVIKIGFSCLVTCHLMCRENVAYFVFKKNS